MKCFKWIVGPFLLIMILPVWGMYLIMPVDQEKVKVGDIVRVRLMDPDNKERDFSSYLNKRTGEIFYLLEQEKDDKQIFKAMVVDPKPIDDNEQKVSEFSVRNFDLSDEKEKLPQQFNVLNTPYEILTKNYLLWGVILTFLILGGLTPLSIKMVQKLKIQRKKKKEALRVWDGVKKRALEATQRDDFEYVYSHRKEIELKLKNRDLLDGFCHALEEIQYKREWSVEEQNSLQNKYESFLQQFKDAVK